MLSFATLWIYKDCLCLSKINIWYVFSIQFIAWALMIRVNMFLGIRYSNTKLTLRKLKPIGFYIFSLNSRSLIEILGKIREFCHFLFIICFCLCLYKNRLFPWLCGSLFVLSYSGYFWKLYVWEMMALLRKLYALWIP